MLIKTTPGIPPAEITDEKHYLRRREFIRLAGAAAVVAGSAPWLQACSADPLAEDFAGGGGPAVAVGQTPLANLSLTLGTHEIVFRHPDLGERKQTIVVTAKGPNRIAVDLTR